MNPNTKKYLETVKLWRADVFTFAKEALGMFPSEPLDELCDKKIFYTDPFGNRKSAVLFDKAGRLLYGDLKFYSKDMFKNQSREKFRLYGGTRYTWQQTVILTAYNDAVSTFGKDSFDERKRWISVVSGHGIGKTAMLSTIALHFLICFFGCQIGATANSEDQLKDIFLKELYFWKQKLPSAIGDNISILDDMVRVNNAKDWYLRARVSRPDKPEALAGLHGEHVLLMADEASGIADMTFQVMKGALTGNNYIVLYTSNGTRTEGEFFESQKPGSNYTSLQFSSEDSPIVKEGYVEKWAKDYGRDSDEFRIRVQGKFASVAEMDVKGWIPLFANIRISFEPERDQIINRAIIGVDPAGQGRDSSIVHIRDNIYLKEVLNEETSTDKDLARKVEMIRDIYNCQSNDIGIDAFGIGAKVIAQIHAKVDDSVNALLTDKPRPGTELMYNSFKSELGWKFRTWVANGGIIITNNQAAWLRVLEKIKYKRDGQGRIMLMGKVEFKKEYGFSPDKFDAAIYTFFKDEPTRPAVMTADQLETNEMVEFMKRANAKATGGESAADLYSSM